MAALINLIIIGTSNTGKSTLAGVLQEATGINAVSTDMMARHPGRPWPTVREHVAEFYTALSDKNIYQFLLHHHENMWPQIEKMLQDNVASNPSSTA